MIPGAKKVAFGLPTRAALGAPVGGAHPLRVNRRLRSSTATRIWAKFTAKPRGNIKLGQARHERSDISQSRSLMVA
jgi:hypothetical protein